MARSTVTSQGTVLAQAVIDFPSCLRQRARTQILESWTRGEQDKITDLRGDDSRYAGGVYSPASVDAEYEDLESRSTTAWGGLVVTSLAQMVYVDGVTRPNQTDPVKVWDTWVQNEWDAVQISLHRAVIAHGLAFGVALPGKDPMTGEKMARLTAVGPDKFAAFFDEVDDQWPHHAIRFEPTVNPLGVKIGWTCRFYDETAVHFISCEGDGLAIDQWTYITHEVHGLNVTPVVRYVNRMDLNGRATGEIEPVIPLLRRIDQGTFDRLIVQRFGAWKVRYIAGLAKPDKASDADYQAMKLRVADLLIAQDPDTKFGTLDATDIAGFINSHDSDLRSLSAITQTPPHHLLGVSANLQAEALAAAEAGLLRKAGDFKTVCGAAHQKLLRLAAFINGDTEESKDFKMQVRWRDTESRSLVQTVNALGIAATALKVPVEMLWEKIPGWSDQDTERAKALVGSGDLIEQLFADMEAQQQADAAKKMAKAVPPTPAVGKGTGGSDRGVK